MSGYEGTYKVSSSGIVKSLARTVKGPGNIGLLTKEDKNLRTRITPHGYEIVTLVKNGNRKTLYVHRLVAITFIPNPEGKPQVNHIDGNKQNNHLSNLEWCTAKENLNHALGNSLREMPKGDEHWKRKVLMTKQNQEKFYGLVGRALQIARQRRNMSITQLSSLSGEQHKTIRGIESGKPHSLHHVVWMKNILGIDVNGIIRDMEGGHHGEESKEISSGRDELRGQSKLEDFI